ncbi:hypothetical protein [Pseudonocardia acidicola]|uniref:Uncharacterized protein n=1 Tax=Pseudonocardia acidicola TaxID=2724939 RepID=A0ABX1SBW8_9PSEU|nr:hypothetical protein [Pseudonocardia acidicola]NMH99055.1 hypothetical protein [Pseudonocardia acidicola]
MSTENTVADRLVDDARKKTAKQESPTLGKAGLIVGIIAVIASPVSIAGWILGLAALVLGAVSVRRPMSAKQAQIAMVLGFAALVVATFFFTRNLAGM